MSDEAVPNPASEEGDPPAEEGAGSTQGANGGNDEEMTEDEAATKIQAAMRGKTARRKAAEEDRMSAAKQVAEMMGDTGAYVREEGRGCTDCLFCLIFAAYWGLMVYLILFAVEHGNLDRLIKPRDMDMHSCGLQTGPVDLRQYNQLYLPNPANKKIQICVNGCPGGATGHCSGNLTRNYLVVDGQPVNTGAAGVALGTLGSLVGMKLPGPDGYDRHDTCVEKGDCSNGDADVAEAYCINQGRCLNSTRPQNANWADDVVSDSVPKRQCLYSHTLETTGHTFEPFTWTPYVWTHNQDQSLFVCMPKEMPGAPTDAAYPPVDFMTANLKGWISASGPCFMPAFASKDILFRCVPLMLKDMMSKDKLSQSAKGQEVVQFMSDIQKYWKVIPLGAGVAVIIAFAWIIFLSKFANYVIWGSVYGIEILLPIVSLFCWWKLGVVDTRSCKAAALDAAGDPLDPTLGSLCHSAHISMSPEIYSYTGDALANCEAVACAASTAAGVPCPYPAGSCVYTPGMYVEIPPAMLHEMEKAHSSKAHTYNLAVGSLIAWVVLGIIFIVFSTRIHIAIGVIEEASDAFLDIPTAVFFPVVLLLISLPVSLFCCFAYFMLLSLRSVDPTTGAITYCLDPSVAEIVNPGVGDPNCHILKGMLFVEVFGWLWTVQWFSSIQYTSVAGAVARWYEHTQNLPVFLPSTLQSPETGVFARGRYFTPTMDSNGDGHLTKDVSHTLLFDAIRRTMRHHLGTMAFGAFITAVVITIKYVLTYMISQIQAQSPENKIIKIGGEILKIAIACLERFIRFVGHIAYHLHSISLLISPLIFAVI